MTSIIGPNAAIRYLKAYQAHVDYWRAVNPAYALAYVDDAKHTPYIQEYAAAFPNTTIIARIHHDIDGGFHTKPTGPNDNRYYVADPTAYHEAYGWLGRINNVVLNVMNEPDGFSDDDTINRLVHWMVGYIGVAAREKTKSLLFNWGDRQPRIIDGLFDGRFDIVLQLMAAHPELFYMGFHLYGPDDITEHLTSYVKRCEKLGITPLKVIASEFGFDKTNGQQNGYRSRGYSGGMYAAWQISQVQHDLAPFVKSSVLVGLNVFQEGNSGGWEAFDIENDDDYKKEIKRAALAGELEPMTTPPKPAYTPSEFVAGANYTLVIAGAYRNLWKAPSVATGEFMGQVANGAEITALEQRVVNSDYWWLIRVGLKTGDIEGWVSLDGGAVEMRRVVIPTPPPVIVDVPTPPASDPVPTPPYPEVSAIYAREMAATYRSLGDTYGLMQNDCYKTAQQWAKLADIVDVKSAA